MGETKVVVSDFGLAGVDGSRHREISGTPGYWPSEQEAGDEQDAKSDIYSFSVTILVAV